ncbi:hypothetical protein JCM10207_002699 [Rhodosporidiobolus poonsookiae]
MQPCPASPPPTPAYRAHLRSLATSLVPPSSSILTSLSSLALAPPALAPLPLAHNEHNLDFWDARRETEWDAQRREGERWEMTRAQVEEVKRMRKEWAEGKKRALDDEPVEEERFDLASWPSLPRLSPDLLLSRRARLATLHSPAPDPKKALVALTGCPPERLLPPPNEAMRRMDEMPDVGEALDLKLSVSADLLAFIKQARKEHKTRRPFRLGSPPLFARASSTPSSAPSAASNPLAAVLPTLSELSDGPPSSPRGRGVRQEEWNKEENIPDVPISPSAIRAAAASKPLQVWSSSQPLSMPFDEDFELEAPLFARACGPTNEGGGAGQEAVEFSTLLAAAAPAELEIDELASDSDDGVGGGIIDEVARLLAHETGEGGGEGVVGRGGVFASDDSMGAAPVSTAGGGEREEEAAAHLIVSARLKVPRLPPVAFLLPSAPSIPPLSAFASRPPPSSSTSRHAPADTSSEWALAPLPGLRALSIALSWAAWEDPSAGEEGAVREVLIGEAANEASEREEVERAARGEMRRAAEMEEEEAMSWAGAPWAVGVASWAEHEEDGEELQARCGGAEMQLADGGESASKEDDTRGAGPPGPPPGSLDPYCDVQDHHNGKAGTAAPHADPADFEIDIDEALALPSPALTKLTPVPLVPFSPPHPPTPSPSALALFTSSSDFGFIFPSSPSPPRPRSRHSAQPAASPTPARAPSDLKLANRALDSARLDELAASHLDARVEKAKPAPSTMTAAAADKWSHGGALDRYLALQGKRTTRRAAVPRAPATGLEQPLTLPTPPIPRSSPPPGAIPFTLPPFLATDASTALLPAPLRIVSFDALLQQRSHLAALSSQGFLPVHRVSRFPPQPAATHEPDLILDAHTCVLFARLVDLLAGVIRPDELAALDDPFLAAIATRDANKPETLFTTLTRLSRRFDRVVVLLEENQPRSATAVRTYAYTPPVLRALQELAGALAGLNAGGKTVEVALSKGPEHSAELVRRLAGYLAGEEARRREMGEAPVLDVWGERQWLAEDPGEDEAALLQLPDLDEFSAAAILGVCSLDDFLALSAQDRAAIFDRLIGAERVARLSALLAATHSLPASTTLSQPLDPSSPALSAFVSLSAIGAGGSGSSDALALEEQQFGEVFDWAAYAAHEGAG